jgi:hypothetical protein
VVYSGIEGATMAAGKITNGGTAYFAGPLKGESKAEIESLCDLFPQHAPSLRVRLAGPRTPTMMIIIAKVQLNDSWHCFLMAVA